MPFSLLPDLIISGLPDLTPELLRERGIRLLMLDFDNTIVPYTTNVPSEEMKAWLDTMRQSGIGMCVVSNSRHGRVPAFCRDYGLSYVVRAKKPGTAGIRRALEKDGISAQQAALAGDQIFTDTLGANLAGVTSILVSAIDNHNIWLKLRHVAEKPFIFAARRGGRQNEKS